MPASPTLATTATGRNRRADVVDQEQEVGDARNPEYAGDRCGQLVHRLLLSIERTDGEHQRKHEQSDAVADDVVAQQDGDDDSRRQLAAGNLDRHQQLAEREHQKRQRQRDDGLIQRRCAGPLEPGEFPTLPVVNCMDQRRQQQLERDGDERDRPQRGLEVACRAVHPAPRHPAPNVAPELAPPLGQRRSRGGGTFARGGSHRRAARLRAGVFAALV